MAVNIPLFIGIIIIYMLLIGYAGYVAWRRTKSAEDFMVAGRETHPLIMALSYGATFISTSAIVGFGGMAGTNGMGLLWLTFLNILVGIFIAFVFFGKRTRKMGHTLSALTFPEFLGKRFNSKFIQYYSGLVIFLGMPLYAAAVLIGISRYIQVTLSADYILVVFVMAIIILLYVVLGGIRGVMYTDAVQGAIMFVGMALLLVVAYSALGGITNAHQGLTDVSNNIPALTQQSPLDAMVLKNATKDGFTGWTSMPTAGTPFWWYLVTTLILGVGIGVLAQPQLAVRFMTVKSNRELNRGVLIGGIFILLMTGTAFTVGALSNNYFVNDGLKINASNPATVSFYTQAGLPVENGRVKNILSLATTADPKTNATNIEKIIPTFINNIMPEWFVYLFMITLLSAAMSTLSAQFHVQGTAAARDVYETIRKTIGGSSVFMTRIGIVIAVILAIAISILYPTSGIVAQATAIFFALCASSFLPVFVSALFWKRATRAGVIAGMLTGSLVSLFMLLFTYKKTAVGVGLAKSIFGMDVLITSMPWPAVDPLVIALPLAILVTIIVSLLTKPPSKEHVDKCFEGV